MPAQSIKDLPVVLTSFALREEYFPEIDAMLATVRQWPPPEHLRSALRKETMGEPD